MAYKASRQVWYLAGSEVRTMCLCGSAWAIRCAQDACLRGPHLGQDHDLQVSGMTWTLEPSGVEPIRAPVPHLRAGAGPALVVDTAGMGLGFSRQV